MMNPRDDKISEDEFFEMRQKHLAELRERGINPYPHKFDVTNTFADIMAQAEKCETDSKADSTVKAAGRIYSIRTHSRLNFYTVRSESTDLQLMIIANTKDKQFLVSRIRRGDVIGFTGQPGRSRTGELTVYVSDLALLSPCLRIIPALKNSFTNPETIYRTRHLDLLVNQESVTRFKTRSQIIRTIRNHLHGLGFMEVETPILNVSAGGAAARPFVTFHNDMKMDLQLRIAPELFLKKLVVGGMDRVFEVGKNFRNEGIDATHNPEFTAVEFYMAYADVHDLMRITENLFMDIATQVKGSTTFQYKTFNRETGEEMAVDINFTAPFRRIDIMDELSAKLNMKLTVESLENIDLLVAKAKEIGIEIKAPFTQSRILDAFVGELIEPQCIHPTFVTGYPKVTSPLAKDDRAREGLVERFEMFVLGKELVNAYTELNMPDVQRERFVMQAQDKAAGDDEAMPADEDFCKALEFGLPPTGGWGLGIDRLVMFLTDASTIRDVIFFPTMRPESDK